MDFNTSVAQPLSFTADVPPTQSPLQMLGQFQEMGLRRQQAQSNQQAMQTHALQQQELQMNLDQRKAINQAYQSAFTPQPDGTMALDDQKLTGALATNGHGEAIPAIMEHWTKYRKSVADLQETNQKVAAAEADAAGNLAATVIAAKNDPTLFHSLLADAMNRKLISKEHFAPIDQTITQAMQADPTGEQARTIVAQATSRMVAGSPEQQKQASARTTAQAREVSANASLARETREGTKDQFGNAISALAATPPQSAQEYQFRLNKLAPEVKARIVAAVPVESYDPKASPDALRRLGMTAEQQTQATQAGANAKETANYHAAELRQGQQRIGIEAANSARMEKQYQATYGALLGPDGQPLQPEAAKAMAMQDPAAVAVANYQVAPPTMSRGGPGAGILRKVLMINPSYNAQNWQTQAAMMKGYTSGSQSKEISGINTALGHVGQLGTAIDALKNGDIQGLNKIANFYNVQTGGDAVTTLKAIVHKVAPEINRAYVGGVGSQGEILTQESDFDPKLGDKQLRSNTAITVKLLRSKIGSLENQWKNTMGSDFGSRFITPEATAVTNKWAPESGSAKAAPATRQAAPQHRVGDTVNYQGTPHKIKAIKADGKLVLEQ